MKTIAILQSSYIPWKGYFDIIRRVDEFVILDEVQFTRRDWRNRNLIKSPNGPKWLTIPVSSKGKYLKAIQEIKINNPAWRENHWQTLRHTYGKTACFHSMSDFVSSLYERAEMPYLSQVNFLFLREIASFLGLKTIFRWSNEFVTPDDPSERLLAICQQAGATTYLSGPSARGYLHEDLFTEAGIRVEWIDYSNYPEYIQLYPPFDHHVSILDLLFHVGHQAADFIRPQGAE